MERMMRAWTVDEPSHEVVLGEKPVPSPAPDEVLVKVLACGVCRTDLHVVDGELPPHQTAVVPGHQVVGTVVAVGSAVQTLRAGENVGIAWLRRTCGVCRWCREGRENLCLSSEYTGWDVDGGYAEYATVPEGFAYPLGEGLDPLITAPLLCGGIVGYRALSRAALPPGGRLGIYGFGSSGHITAQLAQAAGAEIFVMSRGEGNRDIARAMGAVFVGAEDAVPPVQLDSAIVFAPAGGLVPLALEATVRGGTVVLAGIHMSVIPAMAYSEHLYLERDLRTVTANTRADGAAFLRLARTLDLTPTVTVYPFDRTGQALDDLRAGRVSASAVVAVD